MYYVTKELEIAACHHLQLSYKSPCANIHGHNWKIKIYCKSENLNTDGMVVDFTQIKNRIHGILDHGNLNEILPFNPTAENIARWCCEQIPEAYRVEIWETPTNMACYEI